CAWPAPPPGPGGTSPAGCSRTTPGPWWRRHAAGIGACSPGPAPTARPTGGGRRPARGPRPDPALDRAVKRGQHRWMLRTRLTEILDVEHPVMLAGMGGVSYHRLVAAVSEAGGFGCLGASIMGPDEMVEEIAAVRRLTAQPFGVD